MTTQGIKKARSGMKSAWDDHLMNIIAYGFTFLIMFLCLYPLYYTIIASFSDPKEIFRGSVVFWPRGFTFEAYALALENKSIWLGYRNSLIYTVLGTLLNLALTLPASFALSRRKMYGRSIIMWFFLFPMYFGGGLIPTYILVDSLGLIDNFWVMIIIGGVNIYNIIVTRTYMSTNIPEELFESARIDGASEFRVFFQLVLPLSGAIIAVMTLYYAVGRWGDWFNNMIYTMDGSLVGLQLALRRVLIFNESQFDTIVKMDGDNAELLAAAVRRKELLTTLRFALVFVASAPMIAIYPLIQKHFVKGVMVGSLKG